MLLYTECPLGECAKLATNSIETHHHAIQFPLGLLVYVPPSSSPVKYVWPGGVIEMSLLPASLSGIVLKPLRLLHLAPET